MKRLHKVNESLKKYSHVNKKALDQYISFSEQRETLMARKKELDGGQTSIKELVEALDMQKDEVRVTETCVSPSIVPRSIRLWHLSDKIVEG